MSNILSRFCPYFAAAFLLSASLTGCGGASVSDPAGTAAPAPENAIEAPSPQEKTLAVEERDPNRLWCNEHSIYEDECLICHPELAEKLKAKTPERDPNRLWCNEHSVYEDECLICHPELKNTKPESGASLEKTSNAVLQCKEHNLPEMECGICHPERVGLVSVGESMKVRFASENSTVKAGVATSVPPSASASARELLGTVTFNQTRLAVISPLSAGIITEVLKDVGDTVKEGETVAAIQSAELAEARSALQKAGAESELARQTVKREEDLYARQISARQDLEQAQAAVTVATSEVAVAVQRLQSLGISEEEAKRGKSNTDASLPVRAPFSGTIIERLAARGTGASPGTPLFRIADLSTMWMIVSVPESMMTAVQPGKPVSTRFDAYPGLAFEGKVQWVSPSVDPQTRMVQARVELSNSLGLLKDGLFGHASLQGGSEGTAMSVPASAIQDVDGTTVIFRKLEDDLFEARRVEVGGRDGEQALVLAGLAPDEEIVTEGSYVVKSELLKARLGAGCTDE